MKEIDQVMRSSPDEQLKWIEQKINLEPISQNYPDWSNFMELFARRNLFAHAGGGGERSVRRYCTEARL